MEPERVNSQIATSIFVAGEMAGLSSKIDIPTLQEYIDTQPAGFHYVDLCQKAIELARLVQGK